MDVQQNTNSMQFQRDDDAYCNHAVMGKYLGSMVLKFKTGKKTVLVFHRSNSDLVFMDKPMKGVECVMGDSLENIVRDDANNKRIGKFLAKLDLVIVGNKAIYQDDQAQNDTQFEQQ